jgi:osmoprotectant transport system permease protein
VFIFRGLAMVNNQVILAGAIPAAGIAIAVDSGLGYFQKSVGKR